MNQNTILNYVPVTASMAEGKSLPSFHGRIARTRTMYFSGRADDLSSNNGSTILPSTRQETGITNFENGNILPKGTHFLVIAAKVSFDTTAGTQVKTAEYKSSAPAIFRNGELIFKQDGQGMLASFSGTDISNSHVSRAVNNGDDFRSLEVPFMLRPDASFDFQIKLAPGATADIVYKIELRVIEFIDGDKA